MSLAHTAHSHPLLCGARGLLLDFDGPVCQVFAGSPAPAAAEGLRRLAWDLGADLTPDVRDTGDPLAVLRHVAATRPDLTAAVDDFLTATEMRAMTTAQPTPGADELLRQAHASGVRIAIVSNNSTAAITRYLERHDLGPMVTSIHGRPTDPSRMKPEPDLLHDATHALDLPATTCVFVGDSPSDITAGHAAQVPTIAYITRATKEPALRATRPVALVSNLNELTRSLHC